MRKRKVEAFNEGRDLCTDTVDLVRSLVFENSDIYIFNVRRGLDENIGYDLSDHYSVSQDPSAFVEGEHLEINKDSELTMLKKAS